MRATLFEAVLFDLDGVLVDSMHIVRRLWRQWADEQGFALEVVRAAIQGGPGIQTLRRLHAEHGVPADPVAEALRLCEWEHSHVGEVTPIEGAADTLAALTTAGVRWAIVTSGTERVARGRIEHCGLAQPSVLVSADDVARGKPNAEPYVTGAARLGVTPDRCLVVEDSPGGVAAGRAAGATVVGLTGSHDRERLADAHVVTTGFSGMRFTPASPQVRVEVVG